ncbi:hypothetical protein D7030_13860 [Flavobacteriaceae bacterium AU392]|nr:hypothetical protein D1817_04630 [Flavobacteriaceae bacterium]RKM81388.1 hypothetical protein D7030_13860 [Flavobacteriaceae bacterium AU392]
MSKKIRLECSNANHICDKNQYREASLWEKIILSLHLLHCKACRAYTKKNNALTKLTKNPKVETMPASSKKGLKERLAEELAKQNQNQ